MFGVGVDYQRAGVVTHRISCGYATSPPTLQVVQVQEGSCVIKQSIYRDLSAVRALDSVCLRVSYRDIMPNSCVQRVRQLPLVTPLPLR